MTIKLQPSEITNGKKETPLYNSFVDCFDYEQCTFLPVLFQDSAYNNSEVSNVITQFGAGAFKLTTAPNFYGSFFELFQILYQTFKNLFTNKT